MVTRRQFLGYCAFASAGVVIPGVLPKRWLNPSNHLRNNRPTLDPTSIPKYKTALVVPPAMPQAVNPAVPPDIDYYEIELRQFQQQVLPEGFPSTTVWGYGPAGEPQSYHSPSFTIEAKVNHPLRIKYINQLIDGDGRFLPHLLPVDPTLHWANPPSPRDSIPRFTAQPDLYQGPVPMIIHLHGAHVGQESDGFPEAWFLPNAVDIPERYERVGSWYEPYKAEFEAQYAQQWEHGTAIFQYANDQPAANLWFHDHTGGMTRLNVYAGPAGFYLLRGGDNDLPPGTLPGPAGSTPGETTYEIPIAIQDRTFNRDGALFYPSSREFFDDFSGPYVPDSDIAPFWNPEFFGNALMVNGHTWPGMFAEQRRYRFRILNGCNSRFLILKLVTALPKTWPAKADIPFWHIGAESGFHAAPVEVDHLLLGPAERADVIVDFTHLPEGTVVFLINEGPDEPFGGGTPGVDFEVANPETTGQVMAFKVVPRSGDDQSVDITRENLSLPAVKTLGPEDNVRIVSLNEEDSSELEGIGPARALLGWMKSEDEPVPMRWDDEITENPQEGSIEIWELHNFTQDAHPIHLHLVQFEVQNRETFEGEVTPPEPWETGRKDTVIAYPDAITRIKAHFDRSGLYVWHCHILEHEDNEMMRRYRVEP